VAQASVLNDAEIRRVFRIIETTRHAARNRLAFTLSLYAGLRVGEIAALKIRDVATSECEIRREIKLSANQTKGSLSAQWHSILFGHAVDALQRNLRARRNPNVVTFGAQDFCNTPARLWCRDANHSEADGSQAYLDDSSLL
jgi:integrase